MMDIKVKELQELTANMQTEIQQMSDELFTQQKELTVLRSEIEILTQGMQTALTESDVLRPDGDKLPPHY